MISFNRAGPLVRSAQDRSSAFDREARNRRIRRSLLIAPVSCLMIGGVGVGLDCLWSEWKNLNRERAASRESTTVGYENIQPRFVGDLPPAIWFVEEGDTIRLWASGRPRTGDGWFHLKKGEIDRSRLSGIFGKDVIPAIDRPLVEIGDGARWRRLNADVKVVGIQLNGMDCVYPLLLLEKVEAVNDLVWDRPYLVTISPASKSAAVEVFSPLIDGKRVTMGMAGYFLDGEPILFDRKTESLWIRNAEGLKSFSGELKGTVLKRIARPAIVAWEAWRSLSSPQPADRRRGTRRPARSDLRAANDKK